MARKSVISVQPAESSPVVRLYKVRYHFCPVVHVEANSVEDAAEKYRSMFHLHAMRQPIVEPANGGN